MKQVYPPSVAGSNTAVNFMALGYHGLSDRLNRAPKTFVAEQWQ